MPVKKRVTLGDILAHVQGIVGRIDILEKRINLRFDGVEKRLDDVGHRLGRVETALKPAFERLQITVRDHGTRIRKLEKKCLVAA